MTDYLLALILFTLCLGGVPLDPKIKTILYIVLAFIGALIALGGNFTLTL